MSDQNKPETFTEAQMMAAYAAGADSMYGLLQEARAQRDGFREQRNRYNMLTELMGSTIELKWIGPPLPEGKTLSGMSPERLDFMLDQLITLQRKENGQ